MDLHHRPKDLSRRLEGAETDRGSGPSVEKPRFNRDELDVEALLQELPERAREAVVLFYLEDRSYEEVARTLDVPMGTVKTLLFRARKQMIARMVESKLGRSAK